MRTGEKAVGTSLPQGDDFLAPADLRALQTAKLRALLAEIAERNPFFATKFAGAGVSAASVGSVEDLGQLPFTTKAELAADQAAHPPYGTVLSYPLDRYVRMHQTSGTLGNPLRWLDTRSSWDCLLDCWDAIFRVCRLSAHERLFFPFSFGPFLGFWTAFEAATRRNYLCIPGGGMSSSGRLRLLLDHQPTGVLCTPTYALHLAEVSRREGINLGHAGVRFLIVAGEPGGSIQATRSRIEEAWKARVFDHNGLTEVGVVGIECPENPAGLHLMESQYIAEVLEPATTRPVAPGDVGELVLTNLGRWGSPAIRYRTGDLVRVDPRPCPCGRTWLRLEGGVLGRTDDMILLRGNNVYPSAVEAVIRRFPEVAEFRLVVDRSGALARLRIELEPTPAGDGQSLAESVAEAVRDRLLFRAEVACVPPGTLPRFEMKARRLVFQ